MVKISLMLISAFQTQVKLGVFCQICSFCKGLSLEANLALSRVKIKLKPVLGWAGSTKAEWGKATSMQQECSLIHKSGGEKENNL